MCRHVETIEQFGGDLVFYIWDIGLVPTKADPENVIIEKAIAMTDLHIRLVKSILSISVGDAEACKWNESLREEPVCGDCKALA